MANIYLEQGVPGSSLECLRESYDITAEALGEDNKELHSTMYLMGVAMTSLADYENASICLDRALAVLPSTDSENRDIQVARGKTLYQMGTVHEKTGDQVEAISCFEESVKILQAASGNDLELSNALNSLGNLLRNNNHEKALDFCAQSLTIRVGLGDELLVANTKNNIGAVFLAMEDLDRAMAFSAEALRIKTGRLGKNSVETAKAMVNMGQLYFDQNLFTSADNYFKRGLKVFQVELEHDHPDIAMCMHRLGAIREALSDDKGALEHYLQTIHMFKSNGASKKNATLAFSLHSAALIYYRQGNFSTACEKALDALDAKIDVFGAHHFETASSHHWLGTILLELNDPDSSLAHYKDALKHRVEYFGTEHLDVAGTLYGLGATHFAKDEFEESIECLIESLRVLRLVECDDEQVSKSELMLGSCFQEIGQFETGE